MTEQQNITMTQFHKKINKIKGCLKNCHKIRRLKEKKTVNENITFRESLIIIAVFIEL